MKIGWLGLAMIAGLLVPAQAAMNAKMRTFVLNPTYSAMINFGVGAVMLVFLMAAAVAQGQAGSWRGALEAPWWAWCGGLIGAMFVTTAILAVPRIGSASYSVAVIAGQLIAAIVLDHLGALGLPQHSASLSRIGGALLLLAGVWLIQRG
ncbi:MAG: DMT family transporter [Blastocatellia bacterium]